MKKLQYRIKPSNCDTWEVLNPFDGTVCYSLGCDKLSAKDNAQRIANLLNQLYGYEDSYFLEVERKDNEG